MNQLVIDLEHLMMMNAGSGFWHAEETFADDPRCGCSKSSFARTGSTSSLASSTSRFPIAGECRHLFGLEGTDAPLSVRNDVDRDDCRLVAGATTTLPSRPNWHTYMYVFDGAVEVGFADENGALR